MATSFGLCRPSSGQNIYKNLNAGVHNVLFVNVMGSHSQLYSSWQLMPAVVVLSMVIIKKKGKMILLQAWCGPEDG
jgi:hypothetical protein